MTEKRFTDTNDGIYDNQEKRLYKISAYEFFECETDEVVDLLNEQDRKINVLKNSCSIMNQRLLEKEECNYKKAIIGFCKFMHIDTPLLEVMIDEFLQEVF